jgi:hypoxanthine-DNA glycosylase
MKETNPFGIFLPPNPKYMILGSFAGKSAVESDRDEDYNWFYSNKRNQFWPIMEEVYNRELKTKKEKIQLFTKLEIAITDIILSCERKANNNLDSNLINIEFNTAGIQKILETKTIEKIFFSSRFVESLYRKNFKSTIQNYPNIELVTLPSPSPRYAKLTKAQKISEYKKLLPTL